MDVAVAGPPAIGAKRENHNTPAHCSLSLGQSSAEDGREKGERFIVQHLAAESFASCCATPRGRTSLNKLTRANVQPEETAVRRAVEWQP